MLTEIKTRRADEIADILDEDDIDAVEVHVVQSRVHHVCVEVAGATGADLYGGYALLADAYGVVFGFQITLDDRNFDAAIERLDRGLQ
jgi:hypothetical protein